MTYQPFDVEKYKQIFDQMYGPGAFEAGLASAREIGSLQAKAGFAKDDYSTRLKAAQKEAEEAQQAAEEAVKANETGTLDDQFQEYQREKNYYSAQTPIDQYYQSQQLNTPRKSLQQIFKPLAPAQNKNLTPWDIMKMMGG